MKIIYLAIGYIGIALTVGALLLPVIPATPFLIISLFGFSRGSKRIHDKIVSLPFIKPLYDSLKINKQFTLRQKILLSLFTMPVAVLPFILVDNHTARISGVLCAAAAIAVVWLYTERK